MAMKQTGNAESHIKLLIIVTQSKSKNKSGLDTNRNFIAVHCNY